MLKIWKETWKKENRHETPSPSSNREAKVNETSSITNASDLGQSETISTGITTGSINNNKKDSKAKRGSDEIMPISLKRRYGSALDAVHSLPPKRRKVMADTLSRRLPELSEDYGPHDTALEQYSSGSIASDNGQSYSSMLLLGFHFVYSRQSMQSSSTRFLIQAFIPHLIPPMILSFCTTRPAALSRPTSSVESIH
jgi:hypothetical protein